MREQSCQQSRGLGTLPAANKTTRAWTHLRRQMPVSTCISRPIVSRWLLLNPGLSRDERHAPKKHLTLTSCRTHFGLGLLLDPGRLPTLGSTVAA